MACRLMRSKDPSLVTGRVIGDNLCKRETRLDMIKVCGMIGDTRGCGEASWYS